MNCSIDKIKKKLKNSQNAGNAVCFSIIITVYNTEVLPTFALPVKIFIFLNESKIKFLIPLKLLISNFSNIIISQLKQNWFNFNFIIQSKLFQIFYYPPYSEPRLINFNPKTLKTNSLELEDIEKIFLSKLLKDITIGLLWHLLVLIVMVIPNILMFI